MRRPPLALLTVFVLVGCGSSGGDISCDAQYWDGTVGACLPEGWEILSSETLRRNGVPEETVVAFQSKEARDGQFDTVTVTKEPLASELSAVEYSEANVLAVSTLPDYELRDKTMVTIDGEESLLHVFAARPVADKPLRRYYQVSAVKEQTGYTFTGSLPLSVSDDAEDAVVAILRSATFADPRPKKEE